MYVLGLSVPLFIDAEISQSYSQQEFQFHYGRMVPARASPYSESVVWTAR